MTNTFQGVYRLKHYEPKDKAAGAMYHLTFEKSYIPADAVKLMTLFGSYVKAQIMQDGTGYHKIDAEFRVKNVKPQMRTKAKFIQFVLTTSYTEAMAIKAVKLWDKECNLELEEIQQELDLDEDVDGEDEEVDEE